MLLLLLQFLLAVDMTMGAEMPSPNMVIADFGPGFDFGLATAPAHVEDQLEDSWLEWGLSGKIPFFLTVPQPERRLDFWTSPEIEIELAAKSGVKIFRMGVDWSRLVPHEPGSPNCYENGLLQQSDLESSWSLFRNNVCRNGVQNEVAMKRYIYILELVRLHKMKVMLTFFHHSLPKWANEKTFGGWTNVKIVAYFKAFVKDVVPRVAHLVDLYTVFNEPAVFVNLVYGMGMWPGRLTEGIDGWAYWNLKIIKGTVVLAYEHISAAHSAAHDIIKELDVIVADADLHEKKKRMFQHRNMTMDQHDHALTKAALVGIAHNVAWYLPGPPAFLNKLITAFLDQMLNVAIMDQLSDKLDFIGINYYGKEYITNSGSAILRNSEYSESGRAISPEGFYKMIAFIHEKYNKKSNRSRPILITENGISDATDVLRPSYMIEHLMAVEKAIHDGIPIKAYVFWTISDNWEWADGYCPKFGLASVNRLSDNLERVTRPSFNLFTSIATSGNITLQQRVESWKMVKKHSGPRPFCRSPNGKNTVTKPTTRPFAKGVDWLFESKLELFPRL